MANASDLPTEVWLLIAWYLPKSQLSQLKSLNSFFLNCWMDTTWRKVMIDTEFPQRAVRSLSRMVDPFVKTRTKRLTLCLRHFKPKESSSPSSSKLYLSKLTSRLLPKPKSPTIPTPTFQSALTHLFQSLPLMPHITSLKIELWHIPLALLPTLYQKITTSPIALTIQKLRLSGHVDMFALLGEYSNPERKPENSFGNLIELNLELINRQLLHDFDTGLTTTTINASNSILGLAQFVLSLSPSLELLRIWNWSTTLDLSLFFSCLSQPLPNSPSLIPFPKLKSLLLILPFNTSLQASPESLHNFLVTHSNTLQHLQLRLKMKRAQLDPSMEEPLGMWLNHLVDDAVQHSDNDTTTAQPPRSAFFPNLQSLDIYPTATSAGLSALLSMIKRTAPTLSSLTIRDRYLTGDEAKQVLNVLTEGGEGQARVGFQAQGQPSPVEARTGEIRKRKEVVESANLKSLRINVTHLTIPFLDLLARKHPQLQSLWLSVSEIVGSDQHSFRDLLYYRQHTDFHLVSSQSFDHLATWKLRDLSIWQAGQKMDDVVRAVAGAVPAVVGSADYEPTDDE